MKTLKSFLSDKFDTDDIKKVDINELKKEVEGEK